MAYNELDPINSLNRMFAVRKADELLHLPLRGDRNYVRGVDLCEAMIKIIGKSTDLSLQIHKRTTNILRMHLLGLCEISKFRSSNEFCALMTYNRFENRGLIAITETETPVTSRLPYNEELVIQSATIIGETIVQDLPASGTFMDRIVALNKKLLNTNVVDCSWSFGRIDLTMAPVNPRNLCLRILNEVGGKFYQSSITGDGVHLGNIYFSKPSL